VNNNERAPATASCCCFRQDVMAAAEKKTSPAPLRRHTIWLVGLSWAPRSIRTGLPISLPVLFACTQSPKHAIIKASSCDPQRSIKVLYRRASRMTTRKWAAIWSYGKNDSPPVASCQRGGPFGRIIDRQQRRRLAESSSRCGWTRMKASSRSNN
jgi:hypothetical protein